ncbi:hypothetical protein AB0H00_31270 [Nocardia sp. NPDC023852]|uniref:hypothetical protein n=1 Tax=Nocardia sp. NPDC023852 TaxID=3154697 RepID=UPI0033C4383E
MLALEAIQPLLDDRDGDSVVLPHDPAKLQSAQKCQQRLELGSSGLAIVDPGRAVEHLAKGASRDAARRAARHRAARHRSGMRSHRLTAGHLQLYSTD